MGGRGLSCISDNTGLQRLSIDDEGVLHVRVFEEEEFRNIIASLKSEAVALNYSITSFAVSDFEIYLQPMFDILAPRFGNGLRELEIEKSCWDDESVQSLYGGV